MESATSASKKRKICHDDDDDDDDEETMEKFYALIKSIREARDRLIRSNTSAEIVSKEATDNQSITRKTRKLEEEKQVRVWMPSFQVEDFMEEADQRKKPPAARTTSQSKVSTDINDPRAEVKDGLDLTLSL